MNMILMRDCIESLVWQFGFRAVVSGRRVLSSGGLSVLEEAFDLLGWDDPHVVSDQGCEFPGCIEWATCGVNTPDGYKRTCGPHSRAWE